MFISTRNRTLYEHHEETGIERSSHRRRGAGGPAAAQVPRRLPEGLSRRHGGDRHRARGGAVGFRARPGHRRIGAGAAGAPQGVVSSPLPSGDAFEMYDGTAAGAVLAQLRAAGVRMLFHTNTSGFGPLWEAVDAAGDVQVINVTHEGHAVAAAAGYAMASRSLGFFFGSGAGVGNSMSNLYCAWKDRVPLLVTYSHGNLSAQGKDGFESWDDQLRPTEPFTMWTANLLTDEMAEITRRAIRFAYGPPSGPVTMVWGTAQAGERVRQRIDKIDLAKARHQFRAPPDAIQQAARWLVEAKNPVFVVGPEVFEDGATADLLALAEKLSVPVTDTEDDLYANFPTDHPLYMGQMRTLRYPRQTDLMIGFGEGFKRRGPQPGTPTVHVSHDPVILGRVYPVELAIASDVRLAIRDLSDAVDSLLTRDRIDADSREPGSRRFPRTPRS